MERRGRYSFGPFVYDAEEKTLRRGDAPVSLGPKTLDLLEVLIARRGQVVDKAELLKLVWPDTTVEEIGLARNVSLLRKALGDEADEGSIIETVPRRGYRFAAPVAELHETPTAGAPQRQSRQRWVIAAVGCGLFGLLLYWQFYAPGRYLPRGQGERAHIAVATFEALGDATDRTGFSRGLEEQIAAMLAGRQHLYVTSPATVHRYLDKWIPVPLMARVLRLDAVVEGTWQRTPGRVRITARVADIRSGKLIWAEFFDLEESTAQTEAARRIAQAVGDVLLQKQ